jgi:hypothetical protein
MLRAKSRTIVAGILMVVGSFASVAQSKCVDSDLGVLVDAPGHVFYKVKEGALVKRDVTLTVPPCGEGELVLSAEGWKASTTHFFTNEVAGRVIFTAVFIKPFGEHSESSLIITGSYMRGTNKAVYWGDMYKTKTEVEPGTIALLKSDPSAALGSHNFQHVGGFKFKADIGGGEPSQPPQPVPGEPSEEPGLFIP